MLLLQISVATRLWLYMCRFCAIKLEPTPNKAFKVNYLRNNFTFSTFPVSFHGQVGDLNAVLQSLVCSFEIKFWIYREDRTILWWWLTHWATLVAPWESIYIEENDGVWAECTQGLYLLGMGEGRSKSWLCAFNNKTKLELMGFFAWGVPSLGARKEVGHSQKSI